jgi:hypothetical protein
MRRFDMPGMVGPKKAIRPAKKGLSAPPLVVPGGAFTSTSKERPPKKQRGRARLYPVKAVRIVRPLPWHRFGAVRSQ